MDIGIAPDIHSSTAEYAKRFSGVAGEYLLSVQNNAILDCLPKERSILDVGGGHLQIIKILDLENYDYTIQGSDSSCFDRLEHDVKKIICPLLELNIAAKSFSTVISIRQLSHMQNWKGFIGELTRVSQNTVIIDAPLKTGFNLFSEMLFSVKKMFEKNTRKYLNFSEQELKEIFKNHGFTLTKAYYQFFFPMVIHRVIKNRKISEFIELVPRKLGLTSLMGSPAIYRFDRSEI